MIRTWFVLCLFFLSFTSLSANSLATDYVAADLVLTSTAHTLLDLVTANSSATICGVKSHSGIIVQAVEKLKHVAIIPDGNRRWARSQGHESLYGHTVGFSQVAPRIITDLFDLGVHTVTLWCCSPENYNRSVSEVSNVGVACNLMLNTLRDVAKKRGVRIVRLGRKDRIPGDSMRLLDLSEKETLLYTNHVLNLAVDYGSCDELCRACTKLIAQAKPGSKITQEMLAQTLDTSGQPYPNPDLIIRTSGESRLSGFMMWQAAYSELYFTHKHFPEFDRSLLIEAITEFGNRKRRYGL